MAIISKTSWVFTLTLLILLQAVLLFSSCTNVTLPTVENEGILVTGSATIQASPDLATLRVGVQSFAKTAQEATNDNNRKIENIIISLKDKGLTDKDMETDSFNILPQREYKKISHQL